MRSRAIPANEVVPPPARGGLCRLKPAQFSRWTFHENASAGGSWERVVEVVGPGRRTDLPHWRGDPHDARLRGGWSERREALGERGIAHSTRSCWSAMLRWRRAVCFPCAFSFRL